MTASLSARKLLVRDWRGGELGVLLGALVLAVGVIVGISAFVSRLQSSLEEQSLRFLAADRVVSASRELPPAWIRRAEAEGLETAQTLGFSSMVFAGDERMYLASVKAVTGSYPLRGTLRFSEQPFGQLSETTEVPGRGEVWLAPRLFALLEVEVGDTVTVGRLDLRVSGTVRGEPDATSAVFGYGPRLLMNLDDIPATGVVQPGSLVDYRLLLGGSPEQLAAYVDWIEPQLVQGQRLMGVEESQPSIGRTLDRARGFLLLAGSLAVVLAAAAITLAARRFSERHTDPVAVMKSLGATAADISRLYGGSLLLLGLVATVLGCLVGWAIQAGFFAAFADTLPVSPGGVGAEPFLIGTATALVCLGFFAWPPLRRLAAVPPLRVLRRDIGIDTVQRPLDFALGAAAVVGLMLWYSGDVKLTLGVVLGLGVTVACGFVLARLLLRGGRRVGVQAGSVWRLAFAGLQRRGNANALQMVVFAIAIMLLLVLTMIRTSLIDQWQAQVPEGTPNHFLLNLAPDDRTALAAFFSDRNISRERLYPMTRGRVMAVNGEALADPDDAIAERRQREANFTWSPELPAGNRVIAGDWWSPGTDAALVSVETGFAERIGAQLGDTLTVRIAADSFDARIANIREVDWQTMQPNFFMVFPQRMLEQFPGVFMTSFFVDSADKRTLNDLVRAFPTVTVIELDIVIEEIRSIISQVGAAIELVLVVILIAGALVLVAGVQASVDVRLRESALLRALGARRSLLLGALWIEFAVLGALAGLLAVVGAEAAAWLLQTEALDLRYRPTPALWPVGLLLGAVGIGSLGVWSCRRATSAPPLRVLREL